MSQDDYVAITRTSKDDLVQWTWNFWFLENTLWLDFYREAQRPTRRHSFHRTELYRRLDRKGFDRESTMNESDVVLPADLIEEAIKTFCDRIKVKRWSER